MARVIRKTSLYSSDLALTVNDLKAWTLSSLRKLRADVATATGAGTSFTDPGFHNDQSERTITAANAADLATSLVLANQIRAIYEFHRGDPLAHAVVDATNALVAPIATDLTTGQTLANDIKAKYNAHRTQATVHAVNDATNTITSANATDQASLNTLLNELKTDINLHMASGPVAKSLRAVSA